MAELTYVRINIYVNFEREEGGRDCDCSHPL